MTLFTEDDLRGALAEEAARTSTPVDVWPRLRRRAGVRRLVRAGAAVGVAAAAAGVVLVTLPRGHDTNRLSVTHGNTVSWVPNRPLSDSEQQRALDVLRHRVSALDIAGATLQTRDGAVLLGAPNLSQSTVAGIMVRGAVQFRPVYAAKTAGSATITPADAAATSLATAEHSFAKGGCPAIAAGSDPSTPASSYLIACSEDGTTAYLLGPAAVDNASVSRAQAVRDTTTNEWLVELGFDEHGSAAFQTLTADAARRDPLGQCGPPQGCNSIGIVVDGIVTSTPAVLQPGGIRGGATQITGTFTREQAQALAAIAAAPPLPTGFAPDGN